MDKSLKNIYLMITGLLVAMTAQVNGAEFSSQSSCCEKSCCDSQQDLLFFKAELLYWRPELCGLESAFGDTTISTSVNNGFVTTTINESDKKPHNKWNTGFRIGAEYDFDCFEIEVDWTHFDGHSKFNKSGQHGHWNIDYDVVDLTFGRDFWVGSCFYIKPFIGIRGARIHQKLISHLETLFTSTLIGNNIVTSFKHNTEKFSGVGPQIGVEADWAIGCNFRIYSAFDVVTYYGNVKNKSLETDTFTTTISISNGRAKRCFNSIGTDFTLGIRWDKSWTCSCYEMDLMLKLGLEQHRIYDFSNLGSDGTLSLDGGVFGAGIGFHY